MIQEYKCSCGSNKSKFYNGSLGYEAIVCTECGSYSDHYGTYKPDEWSLTFIGYQSKQIADILERDKRRNELFANLRKIAMKNPKEFLPITIGFNNKVYELSTIDGEFNLVN